MATVFTDAGENWTADVFDNTANMPASGYWVAWGTSTQAGAKGDTALVAEGSEARVQATMSQPSANVNRAVATLTAASSCVIGEAGLFSSSSAGTCIIRGEFNGIALNANDAIQFTIDLTWS